MSDMDDEQQGAKLDMTLVKGLRILEALSVSNVPLGVSALSEGLGIGKSNVHRLLNTLVELDFVRKEVETRRYVATLKCWEQGSVVAERSRLRRAANPVLRRLFEESGEAVFMAVLSGTDILYLDKIESSRGSNTPSRAGLRVPAIFPATGKVLLAHQPNVDQLLDTALASVPQTVNLERDALQAEMASIRREGFATSIGGWTKHANSIAVPVPNGALPPVAAIGIGTLAAEGSRRALRRFAPMLFRAAAEIGDSVGPVLDPI
jgi:IclR family KDG regulon transcriptional repressor